MRDADAGAKAKGSEPRTCKFDLASVQIGCVQHRRQSEDVAAACALDLISGLRVAERISWRYSRHSDARGAQDCRRTLKVVALKDVKINTLILAPWNSVLVRGEEPQPKGAITLEMMVQPDKKEETKVTFWLA